MPGSSFQNSKARHPVVRVLGPPEDGDHVFNVSGFEKFEATVFHERNVAAGELDFELGTVVGGSEQDGLRFQRHACFPGVKDLLGDVPGLSRLIHHSSKEWLLFRLAVRVASSW